MEEEKPNQQETEELKAQFKKFDEEVTQKQKKKEQPTSGNLKTQLENQVTELKQTFLAFPADPQSAFLNKPYSAEELAQLPNYLQLLAKANPIEARRKELEMRQTSYLPVVQTPNNQTSAQEIEEEKEENKPIEPIIEKPEKKPKKLKEYKQSRPLDLVLFELTAKEQKAYSNSIEFYDAIPKYFWGNQKRDERGHSILDVLERNFVYKGLEYQVVIQPTKLKGKDGKYREYFPSVREELVEDALRKMACEGNGIFLDNKASVFFTLYKLQQELKEMGHNYNITQIKDAIIICASSIMRIQTKDGKLIMLMPFFEAVGLQTQEDWKGHGNKTTAFLCFNPLVTRCIKNKTFHLINYYKSMTYKHGLARWFHKRLSHNFRQASTTEQFTIKLTTVIRDSGIQQYAYLRENIRKIKQTLQEMVKKEVLTSFETKLILEGRKIVDAKIVLTPHHSFITERKLSNKRSRELKTKEEVKEVKLIPKDIKTSTEAK